MKGELLERYEVLMNEEIEISLKSIYEVLINPKFEEVYIDVQLANFKFVKITMSFLNLFKISS
jgi:hypothetical protein